MQKDIQFDQLHLALVQQKKIKTRNEEDRKKETFLNPGAKKTLHMQMCSFDLMLRFLF